jgi:hypothetical protein
MNGSVPKPIKARIPYRYQVEWRSLVCCAERALTASAEFLGAVFVPARAAETVHLALATPAFDRCVVPAHLHVISPPF